MKKTSLLLIFLSLLVTAGCSSISKMEKDFSKNLESFFSELWIVMPEKEMSVGRHKYDQALPVLDRTEYNKRIEFLRKYETVFSQVDAKELTIEARADLALATNFVKKELWELEVFKRYEWDASSYNIGPSIQYVLYGAEKDEEEKLKDLIKKMQWSTAYYAQAKKNIKKPSKTHIVLAINQNKGLINFLEGDLKKRVQASKLEKKEKQDFENSIFIASSAVKDYLKWLRAIKKSSKSLGGFRSNRIGSKLYQKKFELDLMSRSSAASIYLKAKKDKIKTLKKMKALARKLWPKYMGEAKAPADSRKVISTVINKLSEETIEPNQFIETIKDHLPKLHDFVRDKDLFVFDSKRRLKVREMPEYMRDYALVLVDAPGPFESKRTTYYNVLPVDKMSPEKQASLTREYNSYTLQILNMNEAVPGKFMQLAYANENPSLAKSAFRNEALVQGWAVYATKAAIEAGYAENKPELELMYYKWFLRVVTNIILDYEIHNKSLSKANGISLLMNDAFQGKEEAKKKWLRAKRSQVQLSSYYAGFNEIYSFREEYKKKLEDDFDLMEFHEEFLSHGSAAVKTVRTLMLEELEN